MVPPVVRREEDPPKDGRGLTFFEARTLVEEIWATLPKSEQYRMFVLWTGKQPERVQSPSFTPRRGGSNGPSGPSKDQKFVSAVSGKRT